MQQIGSLDALVHIGTTVTNESRQDHEYDYLIPRSDGSIVVGGARRDYYTKLNEWFNSYDDSNLIEPAKSYFDGYMQRHFVGWQDSDAYVDQIWSGSEFAELFCVSIDLADDVNSNGIH